MLRAFIIVVVLVVIIAITSFIRRFENESLHSWLLLEVCCESGEVENMRLRTLLLRLLTRGVPFRKWAVPTDASPRT